MSATGEASAALYWSAPHDVVLHFGAKAVRNKWVLTACCRLPLVFRLTGTLLSLRKDRQFDGGLMRFPDSFTVVPEHVQKPAFLSDAVGDVVSNCITNRLTNCITLKRLSKQPA